MYDHVIEQKWSETLPTISCQAVLRELKVTHSAHFKTTYSLCVIYYS